MAGRAIALTLITALIVIISACVAQAASRPASLRLVKLGGSAQDPKCLDGSPPAYFLRDGYGSGVNNWLVYLQGGAWCTSKTECAQRATTPLGSSKFWPEPSSASFVRVMRNLNSQFTGLLSSSEVQNPDYYNWNTVMVVYCDGGGYAGTAGAVKVNASTTIHLDGHRILKSIVADLAKRGMATAKRVLLTGCSAGAQAVSTSCDDVAAAVPAANTKCLMDAGFFLDGWDENGTPAFRTIAQKLVDVHQAQYDADCVKASHSSFLFRLFPLQHPTFTQPILLTFSLSLSLPASQPFSSANRKVTQWRCFFPQNNLEFVSTPVFIINSINDYTAMDILNSANKASSASSSNVLLCLDELRPSGGTAGYVPKAVKQPRRKNGNATCSAAARDALKRYSVRLQNRIQSLARRRPNTDTFLLGSVAHCVTIYPTWLSVQRKGFYMRAEVSNWLLKNQSVQLRQRRGGGHRV
ncbi:unnamed protein product [Closterium sp. Naga37s-1]|nr:unnamed protein product [Closterium sp. Naga37s-1]